MATHEAYITDLLLWIIAPLLTTVHLWWFLVAQTTNKSFFYVRAIDIFNVQCNLANVEMLLNTFYSTSVLEK